MDEHNFTTYDYSHAIRCFFSKRDGARRDGFKTKKRAVRTDLQSAFDQIEGNHSRVCGATAQNPTKATQDEILL